MKISQKYVGEVLVVSLSGTFYGGPEVEELREIFRTSIEAGKSNVVVNLKHLTRITSIGLGVLIGGLKRTTKAGGKLVIAQVDHLNLYYGFKIDLIFDIFDSVEGAVVSFHEQVS